MQITIHTRLNNIKLYTQQVNNSRQDQPDTGWGMVGWWLSFSDVFPSQWDTNHIWVSSSTIDRRTFVFALPNYICSLLCATKRPAQLKLNTPCHSWANIIIINIMSPLMLTWKDNKAVAVGGDASDMKLSSSGTTITTNINKQPSHNKPFYTPTWVAKNYEST